MPCGVGSLEMAKTELTSRYNNMLEHQPGASWRMRTQRALHNTDGHSLATTVALALALALALPLDVRSSAGAGGNWVRKSEKGKALW